MTEWFARAVLHVADVEGSLRFYVEAILDGTDESVLFPKPDTRPRRVDSL